MKHGLNSAWSKVALGTLSRRLLPAAVCVAALGTLAGCAATTDNEADEATATAAQPLTLLYTNRRVGCAKSIWFYLKSSDGYYCTAENGGGGALTCNRPAAGEWERFRMAEVQGGSSMVVIRTDSNHYITAWNGGGSTLTAGATVANIWEEFLVVLPPPGGNTFEFATYRNLSDYIRNNNGMMDAMGTASGSGTKFTVECGPR